MTLAKNRENIYRLLGRLYKKEITPGIATALKSMDFPLESGDEGLKEGYIMLADYLENTDTSSIEELDVDFAKVFLGAGISEGAAAFPYESVYTSRKKSMMQEARDQVMEIYASKGLVKNGESEKLIEDHVSLELDYMAYLCGNGPREEQKSFLENHLLNWVPKLCQDIQKHANTNFYKAVAKITESYLKLDYKILDVMEGE